MKHELKQYFRPESPNKAIWRDMEALPQHNAGYTVYVYRTNAKRSLPQNKVYWMWLGNLEEATGEPSGKFHKWFGMMFIPEDIVINGIPMKDRRSTTELNRKEFSAYLEKIEAFVISEMGLSKDLVPWPKDMTTDQIAAAEHL